jgi:hypothetical protein
MSQEDAQEEAHARESRLKWDEAFHKFSLALQCARDWKELDSFLSSSLHSLAMCQSSQILLVNQDVSHPDKTYLLRLSDVFLDNAEHVKAG